MESVLAQSLTLLGIVLIGYALKRAALFRREDAQTLSKIILNLTLPCVVIRNLNGIALSWDLLWAVVLGFMVNLALLAVALLASRGKPREDRFLMAFSLPCFNIGNFAVPVLSGLVSPVAMAGVLAFNLSTQVMTYGVVPTYAAMFFREGARFRVKSALMAILRNVPSVACVLMVLLAAAGLRLPEPALAPLTVFANANTPLAMLSIGILAEWSVTRAASRRFLTILALRLSALACMAALLLWAAPIAMELRRALTLVLFSPMPSCMPVLALNCGYREGTLAGINSAYILISVLCMAVLIPILY